jgi:hypothetical protein
MLIITSFHASHGVNVNALHCRLDLNDSKSINRNSTNPMLGLIIMFLKITGDRGKGMNFAIFN